MSTVHFSLVEVNSYSQGGKPVDVPSTRLQGVPESITSSGSSQTTDLQATKSIATAVEEDGAYYRKDGTLFWRIANMGTDNIYVAFGTSPTASSTTGYGIPAGGVDFFAVSVDGEKAAVINA